MNVSNKVWHLVSEKPEYKMESGTVYNQIAVIGAVDGKIAMSVCEMVDENTLYAPISEKEYQWGECPFKQWAYVKDLLPGLINLELQNTDEQKFRSLVAKMRQAQREYFRTRGVVIMQRAMDLEKQVDEELRKDLKNRLF